MEQDLISELHEDLGAPGAGRYEYTRRAFQMLPPLTHPRVLDVGCGRGGPTLELARLSEGQVVGVDIDAAALRTFVRNSVAAGLVQGVQAVKCSLFAFCFADACFDLVWAEGSIFAIGFARGLKEWSCLIKPGGYLVVHEMVWLRPNPPPEVRDYWRGHYAEIETLEGNLARIPRSTYELVEGFALPEDAWWTFYYGPLERRIQEFRIKYDGDSQAEKLLDREQRGVDSFKSWQRWYGSAYFVLRKKE
jgi:SAM-dependent methyltransferase